MKQKLRPILRERLKALAPDSYAEKSDRIREKLEALPEWQTAVSILVYLSKPEEVDTHRLVQDALKEERQVYAPKVAGDELVLCPIKTWEDLKPGRFGILEPCEIMNTAHPAEMDLILVPGIGFDRNGHRLGSGRGFYDRLLKITNGFKVGLAFEEQIVDALPTESHDVPLDLIISDESLIRHSSAVSPSVY